MSACCAASVLLALQYKTQLVGFAFFLSFGYVLNIVTMTNAVKYRKEYFKTTEMASTHEGLFLRCYTQILFSSVAFSDVVRGV